MQIYEAAIKALTELGRPSHLKEIHRVIVERGYFSFSAEDPIRALGVQIDRHSKGVFLSKMSTILVFYRASPASYGLIDWLGATEAEDLAIEQEIALTAENESLDSALFLEQELQRWLFKNWQQSKLTALGFGALELFDPEQQIPKFGKYYTRVVGEIDMFFRTSTNDLVICELKRQSDDQTIGQLCRYWGWAKETLGRTNDVFGVVLAQEISDNLKYAIKATNPNLTYRALTIDVTLGASSR